MGENTRGKIHGTKYMGENTRGKINGTKYMGENTRDKRHGGKYMGQNTWDKNSLKIEFKLFCTVPWSETCTLYGLRPLLYLV